MLASRIFCVAIFAATLTLPAAADVKFGVAAEPYPPFTAKNASGQWEGWEVDLMDAVCAEMRETCSIVEVAWDGIIPALESEKFDAIMASMAITDKRKKVINFSDYYYGGAAALIGQKNGDMDITPQHLSGKLIGVQQATVNEAYVEKYFVPAGAKLKSYPTEDEMHADLVAGRVEYGLSNALALDAFLLTDEGKACCEDKGSVPNDPEVLGNKVGFGLRKGSTQLELQLNAAIAALAKSGKLAQISDKWKLTGKISLPAP